MTGSYFVCATPRTGSSLLLGLLASSGVAGRPEAYFRAPDEQDWAERWGIAGPDLDYRAFVRAARAAGTTPNGVFGAKLMWGTLDEVVAKLAPGVTGSDLEVLESTFGPLRFVSLHREDELAQAVSWLRAEQTETWWAGDPRAAGGEPAYDRARIAALLDTIADHNTAWREWFTRYDVTPCEITYEQLAADPDGTTLQVLAHLGLEAAGPVRARHRRQADALNSAWAARYRTEAAR
jgi:trehalose 2-sulfotransferase